MTFLIESPVLIAGIIAGAIMLVAMMVVVNRARRADKAHDNEQFVQPQPQFPLEAVDVAIGPLEAVEPIADVPEVEEMDPLAEARILASYGRVAQAASMLRLRLAQQPKDTLARELLLEILLDADDEANYVTTLQEWSRLRPRPIDDIARAVADGLLRFPDNPHLHGLAQIMPGAGADVVGAFRTEVAEAADERPAQSKGATVIPFRADPKGPPATKPHPEPAEPHRADVIPLVSFRPQIDWLSPAELVALRGFFKAEELDDLGLGAAACDATTHDVQWRVAAEPSKIGHYVDLIKRYHRQRNLVGYSLTLWQIFCLLGTRAPELRERLLDGGERLGRHPILAGLRRHQAGEVDLRVLADELSLPPDPVDEAVGDDLPLVVMEEVEDADLPREAYAGVLESGLRSESEILAHVQQLIERHAEEQAMDVLEAALLDNPTQEDLYPLLLDLYVHGRKSHRFAQFQRRILGSEPQPPLESIMRILDTEQRLMQAQAVAT